MTPAGRLLAGLALSLSAHISLAVVVPLVIGPDPVAPQPRPPSKLRIETQSLARSQAVQSPAEGTLAQAKPTAGQALSTGAIRQSRATRATPTAQTVPSQPPAQSRVAARTADADLIPAAVPASHQAPTLAATPAALSAQPAQPENLAAQIPATPPARPALPAQTRLGQSQPVAQPARQARPPAPDAIPPLPAKPQVLPSVHNQTRLAASLPSQPAIPASDQRPDPLPTAAAKPQVLTAAHPQTPLNPAASPVTPKVLATATIPDLILASAARPHPLQATRARAGPALAASPATAEPLPERTAPDETLHPSLTAATGLAATPPSSDRIPQSIPEAEHATAALAFSGGADSLLDETSLATIESFMAAGDASARATQARDSLQGLLASVPCARLQVEFNPDTGAIDLRGHVPDAGLRTPLIEALKAQIGAGITINDAMLILPRPQCGALAGIAAVGLPQSTDQFTNRRLLGADTQTRTYDYGSGDPLVLDIAAPDYDAYVYVDFFDADGQVIHLAPNDRVPPKLRLAQSAVQIGQETPEEPSLGITIGPPYGQEIAAAFAASRPLYDGVRPLREPAAAYLDWLGQQVTRARALDPGFKGEWVYFFISTHE